MKIQNLLILIMVIWYSRAIGAENTDSVSVLSRHGRVSIGLIFSPEYCYRNLSSDNKSNEISQFIEGRNNIEVPKFGYTTGINVQYALSKKFSIESGLNYSNKGYSVDFFTRNYEYYSVYNLYFMDVPLAVNFTVPGKRLQLNFAAGFIANLLWNAKQSDEIRNIYNGSKISQESDVSGNLNSGISTSISLGLIYNLTNNFRLSLMPVYRYSLSDFKESSVYEKLWSAGITLGGFYRFE
jgi:hypothetical protein